MALNYDLIEKTVLFFWDEAENFNAQTTQQKIGKDLFQKVHLIDSLDKLKEVSEGLASNQDFLFMIHLNHSSMNKGLDSFNNSKIMREFPGLITYLISSKPKSTIYSEGANSNLDVFSYDDWHSKIGITFKTQKVSEVFKSGKSVNVAINSSQNIKEQFEIAIITALHKDEFEEVEKIFDWLPDQNIETKTKEFKVGHVKGFPGRRIVAAIPTATGMVDSAVVATMMLEKFKPKYLIMTGVCGGKKSLRFGSIVLASKIFVFQKGKLSDLKLDNKSIELFDVNKMPVDYKHLYDKNHDQIEISVEKFEVEHDGMIPFDYLLKDKVESRIKAIITKVNGDVVALDGQEIEIHFEPVACSSMVINKEGFFEDNILNIDRKTVAVEMESYGVARACEIANDGETKWIVVKSVMDNMTNKTDAAKRLAAKTSALFLKYLIEEGGI